MNQSSLESGHSSRKLGERLKSWWLSDADQQPATLQGPHGRVIHDAHRHPWYKVMCLSGLDYFSTLGYQPGIAALAAGTLAPFATIVLVLLTVCGALPIYRRVAKESPLGAGSIGMLERLMPKWGGKILVLIFLGFAATDYLITMTLSAADATAHVIENPFTPASFEGQNVPITIFMLFVLTCVFLKGFGEAINLSVVLVSSFLFLNLIVVGNGLWILVTHPHFVSDWQTALFAQHSDPMMMIAISLIVFPKLALGLSGFETGVAVMPQIKGGEGTQEERIANRVKGVRRMLTVAALTMSTFLITSSIITTMLIPEEALQEGGEANGRALAYIAHHYMGNGMGTVYDIATILILWFAGASAMAGLLNLVPRYLPRFGMAPEWAAHTRPLAMVFGVVAIVVTILFKADVDHQGAAYATGVLVLITSAGYAVSLSAWKNRERGKFVGFAITTCVFVYTTIVFIAAIIGVSFASRIHRAYELRVQDIVFDKEAQKVLKAAKRRDRLVIVAHDPETFAQDEYVIKERIQRRLTHIEEDVPIVFLEVNVKDASDFDSVLEVHGRMRGKHRVLWVDAPGAPNAIAAVLLYIRDVTGVVPDAYFEWANISPTRSLSRFLFWGQGEVASVTHEVLRRAEPNRDLRPHIHVG